MMKHFLFAPAILICTLTASPLYAQVGDNNATGHSGAFNGQAGSCGYDPYTGNATRSITDIVVAGAVGEYPLALVRTANSRALSRSEVFGRHGGWNHSYNWIIDDSPVTDTQNFPPAKYTVNFPDGRVETFQSVTWDTNCYRVRASAGGNASSAGVRERFVPMYRDPSHNLRSFLTLPDGGKVQFEAEQQYDPNYRRYWYKYHVTAIIDPYGLSTTVDSEVVGQAQIRRITKVTEPAGRYLLFSYITNRRISQVTEYVNGVAKRSVQYNYIYDGWLDNVVYYGNNAWTARYQYTVANVSGDLPLLLRTCDDPMYPGPMRRIAYDYKPGTQPNDDATTPVYGQILNERYWDGILGHEASGAIVSTLTVGEAPKVTWKRKETRGDSTIRGFVYDGAGYVTWASDFAAHQSTFAYDPTYKYLTSFIDFNRNETNYVNDPITGNVTQIKYPLTPDDTPGQGNTRPTVNYTYTNSYYLHTVQDEAANLTIITRDPNNNRATQIDYPDHGYEIFAYHAAHFYQIQSHTLLTGGTETWSYDARHRTDTYRNPDNASGNPTARFLYDDYDRVSNITDVLGTSAGDGSHTTSFAYNLRGQLTFITLPADPIDNWRHSIRNSYNDTGNNAGDGTLVSVTDQLNHTTSYTYDDYRRLKSLTPPVRGNGESAYTTNFYYDGDGTGDDYRITDSNVTWVKFPSDPATKRIHTQYDDNRRTNVVTVAPGTLDEARSSYLYDGEGNVTWITNPLNHNNVHAVYDQRNRPYQITVGPSHTTNIKYDTAGRTKEIDRPNGQVITYDNFDAMNRVTQQTATNTRGAGTQNIRTSYSYYPSGPANLLNTFQDPHLFGGSDQYTYTYDEMGRKRTLQYPLNSNNNHRTEQWNYDAVGRLYQFTNRDYLPQTQTFHYDALHRLTSFSWDDGGITPGVSFDYDAASRLTGITNANAIISRTYFNDNLLKSETETATAGVSRVANYTYDADGNRASLGVPGYTFNYDYTKRNQLQRVINNANNGTIASYVYDVRGNMTLRSLVSNSTRSDYNYDVYDRVTSVNHNLASGTRTIQYGYDDANHSNNRLWAKRVIGPQSPEQNKGEAFSYDLADQVSAFELNVLNPNQVSPSQAMLYDPNGNRQFTPMGRYAAANNLSQYTTRTIAGNQTTAGYEPKGNMNIGLDGSTYTYDAQNRLLTAAKNGVSMTFKYDGLNRQVKRIVTGGANPGTFFSVWDGWTLVEDYHKSGINAVVDATYVYGATGLVREMENANHYYYQDASGSISHVANNSGTLVEWYRYDLDGNPSFYDRTDHALIPNQSSFNVRHLFTGQQWYSDVGLYDLRNRFYSPDIGRFLQPDPIGFWGGNNLYSYCGNNPVTKWDRFGLQVAPVNADPVHVTGSEVPLPELPDIPDLLQRPSDLGPLDGFGSSNPGSGGDGGPGGGNGPGGRRGTSSRLPSKDPLHATTTVEFIAIGNMIEHGDTTDTTPAIDPIDLLSGGIAALVRSSFRSVLQKATVFWAGGRAAEDAARTFAKASGGTVIADTAAGRALTRTTANIPWLQARAQWVSLSEDFARNASGEVYVFQNARGVPLDSIWRNEYQVLTRNPNVTGINFSVVMPDGSVVPVP